MSVSSNTYQQNFSVKKEHRVLHKNHLPLCIWFTGLSGSGKSTIADYLEKELYSMGLHTYLLDGDNVRQGLCGDLDFSSKNRSENIRRVAEVSRLMVDAGLVVISAFISPFEKERQKVRSLFDANEFIEVFVDTPLIVCEERDSKGLYAKARQGIIKDFTGVDREYQKPESPEVTVDTSQISVEASVHKIIDYLTRNDLLNI